MCLFTAVYRELHFVIPYFSAMFLFHLSIYLKHFCFVLPNLIFIHFMKETSHVCFQMKDGGVGQSLMTNQGLPHHLINSQTVSPHLVNSPAVSQHLMGGQSQHLMSSQPAVSHMVSHHALGGHLVTSQPVMSSGNIVSTGLQQVPCSELFVGYKHRLETMVGTLQSCELSSEFVFVCFLSVISGQSCMFVLLIIW